MQMHLAGVTFEGGSGMALGALLAGGSFFYGGFRSLRLLRRIENTPTCRIRSLPMGAVEVAGVAEVDEPLVAPLSRKPVVYYEVVVEEYRSSRHGGRWVTVHTEIEAPPFHVRDDTGRLLVLPDGADAHLPDAYAFELGRIGTAPAEIEGYMHANAIRTGLRRGTYRFRERHIEVGGPVYVLGVAQPRPGLRRERVARIAERLRALRASPEHMAALDWNGDGSLSEAEWEPAREAAEREAAAERARAPVVVARGGSGEMFVISNRAEPRLVGQLRLRAFGGVFGGGALCAVGAAWWIHFLGGA